MMSFEKEITSFLLNYNLAEISDKPMRLPFFSAMSVIHSELALGAFGKVLVGISMWGLIVILVSGLLMWYNVGKKDFKKSLSVCFPFPLRGWHVALGMYIVIFVLIMAFTGLQWNEEWFQKVFFFIFDSGANTIRHTVYVWHVGKCGGIITRIIWFLSALGLASLPLTGLFLWLRRTRKKKSSANS